MKFRKLAAIMLAAAMSLTFAGISGAHGDSLASGDAASKIPGYFGSFSGAVQTMTEGSGNNGLTYVRTISSSGQEADLVISEDTWVSGNLTKGTQVTGYYDQNAPMLMIYPPQYPMEAVILETEDQTVKVDVFDAQLTSSDHLLRLNIAADTKILLQDGKPYTGSLAGRKLAVFYHASTKSIPAQTTPDRIVVLYDREAQPYPTMTGPELEAVIGPLSAMPIVVENRRITGPSAFVTPEGFVMVPVRSVAEGLGFTVGWIQETRTVTFGEQIAFSIGSGSYRNHGSALLWQGPASALKGQSAFVPLQFFKAVAGASNAYVFEGQIVVNNREPMQ